MVDVRPAQAGCALRLCAVGERRARPPALAMASAAGDDLAYRARGGYRLARRPCSAGPARPPARGIGMLDAAPCKVDFLEAGSSGPVVMLVHSSASGARQWRR